MHRLKEFSKKREIFLSMELCEWMDWTYGKDLKLSGWQQTLFDENIFQMGYYMCQLSE